MPSVRWHCTKGIAMTAGWYASFDIYLFIFVFVLLISFYHICWGDIPQFYQLTAVDQPKVEYSWGNNRKWEVVEVRIKRQSVSCPSSWRHHWSWRRWSGPNNSWVWLRQDRTQWLEVGSVRTIRWSAIPAYKYLSVFLYMYSSRQNKCK